MPKHNKKPLSSGKRRFALSEGAGEGISKKASVQQVSIPSEVEKFLDKAITRES